MRRFLRMLGGGSVILGALGALPTIVAAQQDSMSHQGAMHETMMAPHGAFRGSHGHTTSGSYELVTKDGHQWLNLSQDFSLDKAPDPYVVLSADEMGASKGVLNLGQLRQLKGASSFAIPDGTDLGQFTKVLIWCKKYDVTLGLSDFAAGKGEMMHN